MTAKNVQTPFSALLNGAGKVNPRRCGAIAAGESGLRFCSIAGLQKSVNYPKMLFIRHTEKIMVGENRYLSYNESYLPGGKKSTLLSAGWPVSETAFPEELGPEE